MTDTVLAADYEALGLVVIGRNEGDRLVHCLASVRSIPNRVYVDSGSTDGSIGAALREGVSTVELEIPPGFTAARARNAGLVKLLAEHPDLEFVQMVDGDCEIHQDWIPAGLAALHGEPGLAAVYGRLRERFPTRSVYNAIFDNEWNVPIGEAEIIGGIVLLRVSALRQVNFYDPNIIAGEEPDLAMRLRKRGWRLRRIDAEMGSHDADMTRFSQWWIRTRRTGHAFAELAYRHPDARKPNWQRMTLSIIFWGGLAPPTLAIAVFLAIYASPSWWFVAGLALLAWPVRFVRIARRQFARGLTPRVAGASSLLLTIGRIPEFMGFAQYHRNRLMGRASRLIEHKGSTGA
jgi:GT2 family glycosyltransferase